MKYNPKILIYELHILQINISYTVSYIYQKVKKNYKIFS